MVDKPVPRNKLAGKVWGDIEDSLNSRKARHNLVVGKPEPGDIPLYEEKKRQGWGFGYVPHIYRHSGDSTITAGAMTQATNQSSIKSGLGQKRVIVKVTSRFGRGLSHTVYVFVKNKHLNKIAKNFFLLAQVSLRKS